MEQKKRLELYIHIPFCQKKCAYCDFLSAPADMRTKDAYVEALIGEIKEKSNMYRDRSVPSLFIGGGTPSVLPGEDMARIIHAAASSFSFEKNAEITIECNPGTLNEKKAANYKSAGVNRISLGLQSARNEELKLLGRIHTWEDFLKSYDVVRKAGFSNVNVDLMSGLPCQTLEDWVYSLKKVTALRPEHISAYSLIVEEGTPFYETYGEDERRREEGEEPFLLPKEETERAMYRWTGAYLKEHGYEQYEISNYAKPGCACRHNIGYWTLEEYLGLGLGSSSLTDGERFSNTAKLRNYLEGDWEKKDRIRMERKSSMEEYMFLGLRMICGVSRTGFRELFGVEPEAVYGEEIKKLCDQGLLRQNAGFLALTEEGISVSNYVMSEFLK